MGFDRVPGDTAHSPHTVGSPAAMGTRSIELNARTDVAGKRQVGASTDLSRLPQDGLELGSEGSSLIAALICT